MSQTKIISDSIVQTYVKRLDELSEGKARHFLYRADKATGRPDIKDLFLKKSGYYTKNSQLINDYFSNYEYFLTQRLEKIRGKTNLKINDQKKREQLTKHVKLAAYTSLLIQVYYLQSLGFNEIVLDIPDLDAIKAELFAHPNFIKYAPTCATNLVFFSKNLGIFDVENEFIEFFKAIFKSEDMSQNNLIFTNYIYGLTHIIIGASYFYVKTVDASKYHWCLEVFDTSKEAIFQRLTLDINAEVALCYKFLNVPDNAYMQQVTQRLVKAFDERDGYIHRETKNSFTFAEHTNAVALLLFNFTRLNLI